MWLATGGSITGRTSEFSPHFLKLQLLLLSYFWISLKVALGGSKAQMQLFKAQDDPWLVSVIFIHLSLVCVCACEV